jgi:hypothetical protein
MESQDIAWWREYQQHRVSRDQQLIDLQRANDRLLSDCMPDVRAALKAISAALNDTSKLQHADYAWMAAKCQAMAELFGQFQTELKLYNV